MEHGRKVGRREVTLDHAKGQATEGPRSANSRPSRHREDHRCHPGDGVSLLEHASRDRGLLSQEGTSTVIGSHDITHCRTPSYSGEDAGEKYDEESSEGHDEESVARLVAAAIAWTRRKPMQSSQLRMVSPPRAGARGHAEPSGTGGNR
ncbi:hypothetical protein ARTHRO9V_280064 [Arthrobacter sp. 9V]|nr:hypothetical protein ARTHRO9V_280064 [Arthrobacter sp. 9V]